MLSNVPLVHHFSGETMSVDQATVRRIAHLARIAVNDEEVPGLEAELNAMLAFVQELDAIDVAGVEPMTSVIPMHMRMRADEVTDHAGADVIIANAPAREDRFFVVPKVVE
jgi:aspartyl-tRNA(Asn)/glutamyl-tRNA(Gln) amidotransferase subunit C